MAHRRSSRAMTAWTSVAGARSSTSTASRAAAASEASPRAQLEAGDAICPRAAGGFGDAEVDREQCPAELVLQGGIASRQAASEGITQTERLACDVESVQPMVVEGAWRARHRG
jgi:hypothetical protein